MNHLVDTNVLIVASAHAVAPKERDATPEDPTLREKVFVWLDQLSTSDAPIVLDYQYAIFDEYRNKLGDQDFGIQVILSKQNANQVIWVGVDQYDEHGYAILPAELAGHPWDNSDKKFGVAAFEARKQVADVEIVNSSDTDWYDVAPVLAQNGIVVKQLLDAWCRLKYREKKGCEPPAI